MESNGAADKIVTKTSFTDLNPSFPYQSTEAKKQLGIPDSPEIHLAITSLADELLRATQDLEYDPQGKRIQALRCASGAALFCYPIELAMLDLRSRLGMHAEETDWARAGEARKTDWLSRAVEKLRSEGVPVNPKYRSQASRYGWRDINNL